MSHMVGKGIIALIRQHEPLALKGDPAATARVMMDLGDSVGGLLAFTYKLSGEDATYAVAVAFVERVRAAAPEIVRKAEATVAARRR